MSISRHEMDIAYVEPGDPLFVSHNVFVDMEEQKMMQEIDSIHPGIGKILKENRPFLHVTRTRFLANILTNGLQWWYHPIDKEDRDWLRMVLEARVFPQIMFDREGAIRFFERFIHNGEDVCLAPDGKKLDIFYAIPEKVGFFLSILKEFSKYREMCGITDEEAARARKMFEKYSWYETETEDTVAVLSISSLFICSGVMEYTPEKLSRELEFANRMGMSKWECLVELLSEGWVCHRMSYVSPSWIRVSSLGTPTISLLRSLAVRERVFSCLSK